MIPGDFTMSSSGNGEESGRHSRLGQQRRRATPVMPSTRATVGDGIRNEMMNRILMIAVIATLSCGTVNAQIHRVAQMNTEQIRALDKQRTVVILPGGMLEEHGPHLPSFTDGYSNEWLTQKLAEAIVERPGWAVLVFPIIPLGHAGGNEIGGKYVFP